MSIASEITRISTNVENAYSAANAKGATMPVSQNSDNLATTIASIPQAGGAVIDSLSITPSTSAQTITAPAGLDGYNPITVSAVTSSIDANIVAGNIKKDVSILGVTGSYEGVTPSGTLSITQNGTYDVTNYASADVSVSGGVSTPHIPISASGGLTTPIDLRGITLFSGKIGNANEGITAMGTCSGEAFANADDLETLSSLNAFANLFYNKTGITSLTLRGLKEISTSGCFAMCQGCTGLTSVNLESLENIKTSGAKQMFYGCTSLKSIYLPSITAPDRTTRTSECVNMFKGSGLEVADLRNLKRAGSYGLFDNMFAGANSLKKINLNALEYIGTEGGRAMLAGESNTTATALTNIYFPMLTTFGTNPFYSNAFLRRDYITIHFRKDAQATVEALVGYSTKWSAGENSSVVFDLNGTLTGANGNSYTRSESDSVYASETAGAEKTATAWKNNNTLYYTVGETEPAVGDTIYSDSACTTAVTTISAVA